MSIKYNISFKKTKYEYNSLQNIKLKQLVKKIRCLLSNKY